MGIIATNGFAQDSLCTTIQKESYDRYVSSQIAVGHLNQLDTYLSQEKYRGTQLEFVSEVVRDSRKHHLTYSLTHEGALANARNRADNGSYLSGHYDFAYSIMRKWCNVFGRTTNQQTTTKGLTLRAGAFVNGDVGFCYFTKSAANNPAQAYLSANMGAQVMGAYSFRLLKKNMKLSYEARLPLIGLMFSPNYGQSYYEIFTRGNYDHNIVFTSIGTFQLRQQLCLDIPVAKRYAVRVGYLCDIRQATPNNLKQHQWYNAAVIGVTITK